MIFEEDYFEAVGKHLFEDPLLNARLCCIVEDQTLYSPRSNAAQYFLRLHLGIPGKTYKKCRLGITALLKIMLNS